MRSIYLLIKGNSVAGQTFNLKRARIMADEMEREFNTNVTIVKELKR